MTKISFNAFVNELTIVTCILLVVICANSFAQVKGHVAGAPRDAIYIDERGDTIVYKNWDREVKEKVIILEDYGNCVQLVRTRDGDCIRIANSHYDFNKVRNVVTNFSIETDSGFYCKYPVEIKKNYIKEDGVIGLLNGHYYRYKYVAILGNVDTTSDYLSLFQSDLFGKTASVSRLNLYNNIFKFLHIGNSYIEDISLYGNKIGELLIYDCKIEFLSSHRSNFDTFSIYNSNISDAYIELDNDHSLKSEGIFVLESDSLEGNFRLVSNSSQIDYTKTIKATFSKCAINTSLKIDVKKRTVVEFRDCEFGADFSIEGESIDTVKFINCNFSKESLVNLDKLKGSIPLTYVHNQKEFYAHPITIYFDGTDVKKFNFNYNDNLRIGKNEGELYDNSYETTLIKLLEKFKEEGKAESYKRVDIELKQLQFSKQGIVGLISNNFHKLFWDYGYSQTYPIFVWGSVLLLFSFFNFWKWDLMNKAYKVGDEENPQSDMTISLTVLENQPDQRFFLNTKYSKPLTQKIKTFQNFLWVLLYTSVIFFSIKIAKDRLHFKGNGVAVFFYSIQYLVGLILLIFTVKFVIEL